MPETTSNNTPPPAAQPVAVAGQRRLGGTRTVDVHIRRLRAKLGDLESLIGTVHNVGYRFTAATEDNFSATNR